MLTDKRPTCLPITDSNCFLLNDIKKKPFGFIRKVFVLVLLKQSFHFLSPFGESIRRMTEDRGVGSGVILFLIQGYTFESHAG